MPDKAYIKQENKYNYPQKKPSALTLSIPTKIKQQYPSLTRWEKMFVSSFYERQPRPTGKDREQAVRQRINAELERLLQLDPSEFEIDYENNPDLDREFESELRALEARGEGELAKQFKQAEKESKHEMAKKFSATLYAEYKHIVDFISSTNFEPAFKVLMLQETLSKTYKKENDAEGEKTIVKPRDMHKTIASHMTLNQDVLNVIYNEVESYQSFANLYFAGIALSNKTITQKSGVKIDGLDTFGMGKWIKFEGKQSNRERYIKNAQELASLVQNTPWCTKNLASSQLEQGDFFVFVDNENNPHIAVKMSGNQVDEVRGVKGGNAQELEDEYRQIAVEFLTKNPEVKNGDKWLAKEEWNARLVQYNKQIENGTLTQEQIPQLIEDYCNTSADYKTHSAENSNRVALRENLPKIIDKLAKHFGCKESEIALGDVAFAGMTEQPYIVILGNANFEDSQVTSLGNLTSIGRSAWFIGSQVTSLGNLSLIGRYIFEDEGSTKFSSQFDKKDGKWVRKEKYLNKPVEIEQ